VMSYSLNREKKMVAYKLICPELQLITLVAETIPKACVCVCECVCV
jgi:hypothetical protein